MCDGWFLVGGTPQIGAFRGDAASCLTIKGYGGLGHGSDVLPFSMQRRIQTLFPAALVWSGFLHVVSILRHVRLGGRSPQRNIPRADTAYFVLGKIISTQLS